MTMYHGKKLCSIKDCEEKHQAKGYCAKHYERVRRHGDPYTVCTGGKPCNPVNREPRALSCRDGYQDFCTLSDIFPGIVEEMFKAD